MNEHFGQGTASYTDVRDDFTTDEMWAWFAFFGEAEKTEALRKAQEEHDELLKAAAAAAG
jgi:hypothetical protein